jgi:hypothetical protein
MGEVMFKNYIITMLMSLLLFSGYSIAEDGKPNKTVAEIKSELINNIRSDGYLSERLAQEVSIKYVKVEDTQSYITKSSTTEISKDSENESNWSKYFSLVNVIKAIAVILLLFAFSGLIETALLHFKNFIMAIPVYVYQSLCLVASIVGIIKPEIISEKEFFFVALFSSFSLIIVLFWILSVYEKVQMLFNLLFKLGIPKHLVAIFYGLIYFAVLALVYKSSIFGFFATIAFSSLFACSLAYIPGIRSMNIEDKIISSIVISHSIILGFSIFLNVNDIYKEYVDYFNFGIQYYCTILLGAALVAGASPFEKFRSGNIPYILAFITIIAISTFGYFFWDIKIIASILICFFLLSVLIWVGYIGYNFNFILGTALLGSSLYSVALFLEKYSSMVILYIS